MHQKTIKQLHQLLTNKEISCVELANHFLKRIENNADLNSLITVTEEIALQQAKLADKQIATGEAGMLTGIPLIHKDLFCTRAVLTTCGSKILGNFISPYDATVVQQMQQRGMVMLGKGNMDEFAMGSSNETSYYGSVKNPWDKTRVPGGSSGGSAAAVSARLVPIATATDTGGSIRQPAAFCGLTGIKPSYGRVSRYGMVAFASSLDQGGILATNAADAALALQAICGFDEKDSTSLDIAVENYFEQLKASLKGKVIGLPKEFFTEGVDNEVLTAIHQAVDVFRSIGATTVEISLPNTNVGIPCYYVLAPAEASSNLSRFDGVRYGYRAENYTDLTDMYKRTRAQGFGDEVKRRIMIGTYVLSSGYYDAYYVKAQKLRRMISDEFTAAFKKCDFIAGPTTPSTAFVLNEKNDDSVSMYLNDIFTNSANLAGLPALSMAAGFDNKNLPIGLHLIGKYLDENTLLNAAYQYQQQTDWHTQIPQGYE